MKEHDSRVYQAEAKESDQVTAPFSDFSDWMISSGGKVYGGFAVNLMRSQMRGSE